MSRPWPCPWRRWHPQPALSVARTVRSAPRRAARGLSEIDRVERNEIQAGMVLLANGDRRAFRPVFDALHPLVLRWCRHLLRNDADAEDATQLALQKLFFQVSSFDVRGDALGWALAVATAECRTLARKRTRRRETADIPLAALTVDGEAERSVAREEMRRALGEVLGTMKAEDVHTLLAWIEVEPRPEVPGPTFRKRLERAVRRMREAWRARYGLD